MNAADVPSLKLKIIAPCVKLALEIALSLQASLPWVAMSHSEEFWKGGPLQEPLPANQTGGLRPAVRLDGWVGRLVYLKHLDAFSQLVQIPRVAHNNSNKNSIKRETLYWISTTNKTQQRDKTTRINKNNQLEPAPITHWKTKVNETALCLLPKKMCLTWCQPNA